ncbi:hypothetical protein FGG08_003853 [Glutinoglossum americanum]|uniref:CFEM domain-containing protein n=1 Tax=Glutinoglossum americanum TaxID=1670608 RepID=A0A9P8L329_9PEZI|nr:hypothetical protein FGG08_003853 [Glutinoglossum americanum]
MRYFFSISVILQLSLFSAISLSQSSESQLKLACSLSGYSDCVCSSCVVPIYPIYCPNLLDLTCPCLSTPYLTDVTSCVIANCTVSEGRSAWAIGSSACSVDGVTLPTSPPVPSSGRGAAATTSAAVSVTVDAGGDKSTNTAGSNGASTSGGGGLSTGAIVGIIVGAVGGIAIGAVVTYFVLRRRQAPQPPQPPPQPPPLQPAVMQPMVQPLPPKNPYIGVAYPSPPPPPGQELHSESAYPQQAPQQTPQQTPSHQKSVLPIPELQSQENNRGPPPPASNAQQLGYTEASPPLYEMPSR